MTTTARASPTASPWNICSRGTTWPRTSTAAPPGGSPAACTPSRTCVAARPRAVRRRADRPPAVVPVDLAGHAARLDPGHVADQQLLLAVTPVLRAPDCRRRALDPGPLDRQRAQGLDRVHLRARYLHLHL